MIMKLRLILQALGILKRHKEKVAVSVLILLTLPMMIILLVSTALFSWGGLNSEDDETLDYTPYRTFGQENSVTWQEAFVIDLAMHDFNREEIDPSRLIDYYIYYVEVTVPIYDEKGKIIGSKIEKQKRVRSFSEVMDHLNFSEEQRSRSADALALIYDETGGGFTGGIISDIGAKQIPAQFIPIYKEAETKFGVPWNLLAGVHRVETVFSTNVSESSAGAVGHMQFMPCTWIGWNAPSCTGKGKGDFTVAQLQDVNLIKQYGGYGTDADGDGKADPWTLKDAIFSAAKYLAANGGASGDLEGALWAYNNSTKYRDDVLYYANLYVQGYEEIDNVNVTPTKSGFAKPISGQMSSDYGYRIHPITGERKLHAGVDLVCSIGDPVPASKAGTVIVSRWQDASDPDKGYGMYIRIDHGGGYVTTYGHLSQLIANVGDKVEAGTVIGKCGNTGGSTGAHLHFEIRVNDNPVDPKPYIGM